MGMRSAKSVGLRFEATLSKRSKAELNAWSLPRSLQDRKGDRGAFDHFEEICFAVNSGFKHLSDSTYTYYSARTWSQKEPVKPALDTLVFPNRESKTLSGSLALLAHYREEAGCVRKGRCHKTGSFSCGKLGFGVLWGDLTAYRCVLLTRIERFG